MECTIHYSSYSLYTTLYFCLESDAETVWSMGSVGLLQLRSFNGARGLAAAFRLAVARGGLNRALFGVRDRPLELRGVFPRLDLAIGAHFTDSVRGAQLFSLALNRQGKLSMALCMTV